ncbi:MAG: hypothetical protein SNJ57_16230 [Cyanobacteriota bacterium]
MTIEARHLKSGDFVTLSLGGRLRSVQAGEIASDGVRQTIRARHFYTYRPVQTVQFEERASLRVYSREAVESVLRSKILEILSPGVASKTVMQVFNQLRDILSDSPGKARTGALLRQMVERGDLLETETRHRSHQLMPAYRQPLTACPLPFPAMEQRNYRFGWVVGFAERRPSRNLYPLVQWADGFRSLSREGWLEPLGEDNAAQAVQHAIAHHNGQVSHDFVRLPREMVSALRSTRGGLNMTQLMVVGKFLESCLPGYKASRDRNWDWLARNYPGWRYGIVPYELLVLPEGVN